jgi:hypothetical protein
VLIVFVTRNDFALDRKFAALSRSRRVYPHGMLSAKLINAAAGQDVNEALSVEF